MPFPIELNTRIDINNSYLERKITLKSGLTTFIGPNGSGKTHLLRAIKDEISKHTNGKKVRFLSAGRIGTFEQYRSDYNGYCGRNLGFEDANFGSKSDVSRRHKIENLNGDFQTLSERPDIFIKVQERLKKLFKRDLRIQWDGGQLKILFFKQVQESLPYSSGREASGLIHLVGILAALYDDEVGALILDEPEVSLHPQLQAFLLNEIINSAGNPSKDGFKKIIVMATHSTEMLRISRVKDLLNLVFCYNLENHPIQLDSEEGVLKNKKIKNLITRLGQEHKLSLFSQKPLLVEGPSDVTVCNFLSNKLGIYLEASGSQILPVIGKGQMPTVSKFMKTLGKTPVILADADAFADGLDLANYYLTNCEIANKKAIRAGALSASTLATSVYNCFDNMVTKHWDDISEHSKKHLYWSMKKDSKLNLAKKRSSFCTLFTLEENEILNLTNGKEWLDIKIRIESILELLENTGCFILRKGAIESYYNEMNQSLAEGKPSAAVDEIESLETYDIKEIEKNWSEIIRCIKFAASGAQINEVECLTTLLLGIAGPILLNLDENTTTQSIEMLTRSLFNEKADIFKFSVENNEVEIDIKSNILDIVGFPIKIKKGIDVMTLSEELLSSNK